MFLCNHFSTVSLNPVKNVFISFVCFFFKKKFGELLHSTNSPRRFYRIVPFNEALEKLIFPSVASLIPIQLIKLHGIFNLSL